MTDDEMMEVLVDTGDGLSPTEGYGPTIEHVRALIAERDRFRAALQLVAIPPLDAPETHGWEGGAAVARQALDGCDFRDYVARLKAGRAGGGGDDG